MGLVVDKVLGDVLIHSHEGENDGLYLRLDLANDPLQPTADSTNILEVQNAGGTTLFTVDSTNSKVSSAINWQFNNARGVNMTDSGGSTRTGMLLTASDQLNVGPGIGIARTYVFGGTTNGILSVLSDGDLQYQTSTSTSAYVLKVNNTGRVESLPTFTSSGTLADDRAYFINAVVSSGSAVAEHQVRGISAILDTGSATGYGPNSEFAAAEFNTRVLHALSAPNVMGGRFNTVITTNATLENVFAAKFQLFWTANNTGTTAGALEVKLNRTGGTLTSTDLYFINCVDSNAAANISATNFYGLFLPSISGASNNWAIKTSGGTVQHKDEVVAYNNVDVVKYAAMRG